jgi:hypothetical protein
MTIAPLARRSGAILLSGLLAACAPTTPQLDQHFGATVRGAFARQIVDPAAGANPDPVAGIDGRSARAAFERYQKSFVEPVAPANVFTIGVGGGK